MAITIPTIAADNAKSTVTLVDPVITTSPLPTLQATDITSTTASLSWTPASATVTEVGRDGVDSTGGGPWAGAPANLPFQYLVPDTAYLLHAVIDGVRLEVAIRTAPASGVFFDDFLGTAIDTKHWFVCTNYNQGRDTGMADASAANVWLDGNSHLVIQATRPTSTTYSAGSVMTAIPDSSKVFGSTGPAPSARPALVTVGYGRVEASIKVPQGQGLWPSLWLVGVERETWPACGEIDIMENFGLSTTWHCTLHGTQGSTDYNGGDNGCSHSGPCADMSTAFHTYWCEWAKDSIKMGVDTTTLTSFTPASLPAGATWVFNDAKMFILLDMAVQNAFGTPDPAIFPCRMLVDWVRWTPA